VRLAILGGSFNPVHRGHLFLVNTVLSTQKYDRVVMIPAYRSPFKPASQDMETGANDRLQMLAASVSGDYRIAIDDCEIRREGISYTINTLEDIKTRYMPEGKPALIIGDDLAGEFLKWKQSEKILKAADIIIARRLDAALREIRFPHTFINNDVMNISSQMIRQRIKEGGDWRSLVPAGAISVIEDRRLYGLTAVNQKQTSESQDSGSLPPDAAGNPTMKIILRIEEEARETLSVERFLHSRNTALLAYDLCRRFGLDPVLGYLAGIAHDLAKQTDNKQILKLVKSDGMEITRLEEDRPNLLHGRAAAVLLRERFCINNKDVLEAVAFHTSGSGDMGPLAKIIYIADKAEVSRNIEPALRKMCNNDDLDTILFAVLEKMIIKLQSKKLDLSEGTLKLLEKMKGKDR
jgi:nicotinate-nucleotide adenylyltransferase